MFVCLSVIFGTFLITRLVFFLVPALLGHLSVITDVLRIVLASVLAYAWLGVWKIITDRYFWRSVDAFAKGRDEP
jgi:hypothetical protein